MSSLNLVPNPTIMVIEAGIFLANMVVIKKLMLEPYLSLYNQRVNLTKGSQDLAEKLDAESSRDLDAIKNRMLRETEESRVVRDKLLNEARLERDLIVGAAAREANQTVNDLRKELATELEQQKQKIPTFASDLTRQLLEKLMPA